MEVFINIDFFTDYEKRLYIEELFSKFGIPFIPPEKPKYGSQVYFQTPIRLNQQITVVTVSTIFSILKSKFHLSCGESISFKFDRDDYQKAPVFKLQSTGNSSNAFLEHKNNGIEWKTICESCKLKSKVQTSPLVINTSKIGDRYMVNVGTDFWVISEKMAKLMEDWNITGYKLQEVIHTGTKPGITVYQVIPTNTMPALSTEMKYYSFTSEKDNYCPVCNIRGRIYYPYHYNKSDLEQQPIKDINFVQEWRQAGGSAYRPVIISKRFRNLLIENGITSEVINLSGKNYKAKDWFFEPTIILEH